MVQLPLGPDRQALPGVFVDHRQHPEGPTILRPVHDKVVGPNMVAVLGPEPDARTVMEPEPSPLGLLARYFEPFTAPDSFYTLVVHVPALVPEQGRDPPIAIATVLGSQIKDSSRKWPLIVSRYQRSSLRGSGLTDDLAGSPFRNTHSRGYMANRPPTPLGAQ